MVTFARVLFVLFVLALLGGVWAAHGFWTAFGAAVVGRGIVALLDAF